jgi:hypothetical protein
VRIVFVVLVGGLKSCRYPSHGPESKSSFKSWERNWLILGSL